MFKALADPSRRTLLTVTHETATPDSVVLSLVRGGWPQVLSALKTTLETGTAPDESAA